MRRPRGRWILAGALAGLGAAWWQFGVSVSRTEKHTYVARRVFGRVTRVHVLSGLREHERYLFPWAKPFEVGDPIEACAAIFPEVWQDRNHDGRWDTWLKRIGPDARGQCAVEYGVDTDRDGEPDWQFMAQFGEHEKAAAMMRARRGF